MESYSRNFAFIPIPKEKFDILEEKEVSKFLEKWGLKERINLQAFTMDQPFHPYQKQQLLDDFFSNPTVIKNLLVMNDKNEWKPLGVAPAKVEGSFVPCSTTTMDLFNRLENGDILREGGHVNGCLDEFVGEMQISDELRKLMLSFVDDRIESDHADIFSSSEQEEFILKLFGHICLGGSLCQYEDNIEAYLEVTKRLYKEMISVVKDPAENKLVVTSSVYKVSLFNSDGDRTFPDNEIASSSSDAAADAADAAAGNSSSPSFSQLPATHAQTFAYLIVSPQKKKVFCLYHNFRGGMVW